MVLVVHDKLDAEAKRSLDSLDDLTESKSHQRCGLLIPRTPTPRCSRLRRRHNLIPPANPKYGYSKSLTQRHLAGCSGGARAGRSRRNGLGLVPSDIAAERLDHTAHFEMIFPDQQANQFGTVLIPYAVAVKASAPHPTQLQDLSNYLASHTAHGRAASDGEPR